MKISVVIPTMNDSEVFDAIDSVLAQDYDEFEVIVVDGSTGTHRDELASYCDDHDVRYVHEDERPENPVGLNGSRNIGAKLADGEAVVLLDGDCQATPGWLSHLSDTLTEYDVVESKVTYHNEGKACPMDRTVENDGKAHRFLGAGLAFRKAVWEKSEFDERFISLRNDTSFGLDALDHGFTYGFAEEAEVEHHSGRFSPKQFVTERLRFLYEPLFYKEYRDHEHFDDNVSTAGPVLYPKELAYLGVLALALFLPYAYLTVPSLLVAAEGMYLQRESAKRNLDICPKDLLLLFVMVPLAMVAKRYALWNGAVQYRVPVI